MIVYIKQILKTVSDCIALNHTKLFHIVSSLNRIVAHLDAYWIVLSGRDAHP